MDTIRKQLKQLQRKQENIRNICILAHVDHDSLLASNGIISNKLAGKVRYLDSRDDEIERGITMKSSGVSLVFKDHLINLIDSPGHVDFASEVSTASRLCDGCLVLVDSVEGVCTQTHTVLRQALAENVRPILVINKIDRLVTQLKMSPHEAYSHMSMILEEVNAIVGTFHMENLIADDARMYQEALQKQMDNDTQSNDADLARAVDDWILEDRDDEHLYFSPDKGNVVFASAIDGWAFRIDQFAAIYASKLSVKESALKKVLWGDWYLDPKTKRAVGPKGLKGRVLKPFFVQFILDNLWAVYDSVENDREKLEKIVKVLNLKVLPRDLKSKDPKPVLQTVMAQWLPLSATILQATIEVLPSPLDAQQLRIPSLLDSLPPISLTSNNNTNSDPEFTEEEKAMIACDAASPHTIAYVSKMFAVPADVIASSLKSAAGGVAGSTSDRVQLSSEDAREQRRLAVIAERAARKKAELEGTSVSAAVDAGNAKLQRAEESHDRPVEISAATLAAAAALATLEVQKALEKPEEETLIGFARCYSGTVKVGQTLHVLGPKYHPSKPDLYRTQVTVSKLYMLMGRELQELDEVPAGNVFGIGGLDGHVLKTGTLTSSVGVRSFGGVNNDAPILRVALEPYNPSEMNKLIEGLHLLNQADPCVEVVLQETGEHVIITAGALHLERCLKDLRERFAKIEIQVSEPIVPFRETISTSPALPSQDKSNDDDSDNESDIDAEPSIPLPTGTVISSSQGGLATLRIRAVPIPKTVLTFLDANARRLKALTEADQLEVVGNEGERAEFIKELEAELEEARKDGSLIEKELWEDIGSRILSFGPREVGPNLLISATSTLTASAWKDNSNTSKMRRARETSSRPVESPTSPDSIEEGEEVTPKLLRIPTVRDYEGSIGIGFQLAMLAGPLCNEPMMGVAIFLESFELNAENADNRQLGLLPGQVMASMRESCRQAFLKWSPRLALAMYSCDLQAPSEVLGKVYAVLNKRRGRILSEEIKDGTPFFQIKSLLPVIESFGFSDDIRKRTAGSASPQLIFSGFEVLDIDPFWVPTTQEELEDLGEKADRENVAKKYMEAVRKRKGLFVEKKIVEHAEKQRTMKQK
ncbi:UNVERIFIED_CONTAM: Cytoplasmic GTPase/eEF2-like protein (ribosomal biogenesis) [Siphonaria sp. JEL0065]|nr:Cytoplasmic GTPase/eEF2-like protein (ribosomal biogenesis) [Siphonaria sp. JEL0065]